MKSKKEILERGVIALVILAIFIILFSVKTIDNRKPLNMIYISKSIDENNEFWMALLSGAKMAAKEYNVNLTIWAPKDESDYEEQNQLIEKAIEKKPQAILLSASNYTETTPMAEKIKSKGIKLVLIDSEINSDIADSVVSTGNFIAGQKMGNYMRNFINNDTKIAIVSHVKGASTALQRENGVRDGLGIYEDKIIEVVYCESKYDKAYDLTKEIIKEHQDINMIAALNEYSCMGAAKAVKELGLEKKIGIMGFDNSLEEVKLLEEGVLNGIVIQKPFNMGYFGVEQAAKIIKGENYIKYLDCGSKLITKEDMYTEENQKILFPFIGRQFREIQND